MNTRIPYSVKIVTLYAGGKIDKHGLYSTRKLAVRSAAYFGYLRVRLGLAEIRPSSWIAQIFSARSNFLGFSLFPIFDYPGGNLVLNFCSCSDRVGVRQG